MLRRDFLRRSARTLSAALLARNPVARAALIDPEPLTKKFQASDEVVLGHTGIRTSRLAMGTGTIGYGGASNQTRLGTSPLTRLLVDGYHENGLRFFDSADSYGSHTYVAAALKQLARDKVTVLTKTDTRNPTGVRADLDRFRKELGVDYIDVVLIHCVTESDWPCATAASWTSSQKPSRREPSALMVSPAIASAHFERQPLPHGSN